MKSAGFPRSVQRGQYSNGDACGADGWFRIDADPVDRVVALVVERLSADDLWNDLGPIGGPEEQHLPHP
jgi:hypothetical protein